MKTSVLLLYFAASTTAIFLPLLTPGFWHKNPSTTFTKICLYSNDPSKFTPMCIMCPNTLYPIVLSTCIKETAIPLNVTYVQASCIVGNCAVNMPKRRRDAPEASLNADDIVRIASQLYTAKDHPLMDDFSDSRPVPYTVVVDGRNVTITSVQESYVHSHLDSDGNDEDEEEEDSETEYP